jgi:hypothetical protein
MSKKILLVAIFATAAAYGVLVPLLLTMWGTIDSDTARTIVIQVTAPMFVGSVATLKLLDWFEARSRRLGHG